MSWNSRKLPSHRVDRSAVSRCIELDQNARFAACFSYLYTPTRRTDAVSPSHFQTSEDNCFYAPCSLATFEATYVS